jgi:20S proteasome subunit beta 7
VVGLEGATPFCAMVSMIGVSFDDQYICTGFASQLGLPLIREGHTATMSEKNAMKLLQQALKVRSQCCTVLQRRGTALRQGHCKVEQGYMHVFHRSVLFVLLCMTLAFVQVCFYRDKNSINKFIVGKVAGEGVSFSEPFAVATEWNYSVMQNPTKFCIGAW